MFTYRAILSDVFEVGNMITSSESGMRRAAYQGS
jgi:hypothetical protein